MERLTPEQEMVMKRFAKLVGVVLRTIETIFPEEEQDGRQCTAAKRACENAVYDARNDILRLVSLEEKED